MEVKIKIEAPELASALKDIAIALSAMANLSGAPAPSQPAPATEIPEKKPEENPGEEMTPAEKKKAELSKEILTLGGTPPEKGAVSKFEKVLEALKASAEEEEEEEEEITTTEEETTADETDDYDRDDVRTLAHAVIKKDPDNPDKGKAALKGALKTVKAENITEATQAQLNKLVPVFEEYVGKTIADVLAEAE